MHLNPQLPAPLEQKKQQDFFISKKTCQLTSFQIIGIICLTFYYKYYQRPIKPSWQECSKLLHPCSNAPTWRYCKQTNRSKRKLIVHSFKVCRPRFTDTLHLLTQPLLQDLHCPQFLKMLPLQSRQMAILYAKVQNDDIIKVLK